MKLSNIGYLMFGDWQRYQTKAMIYDFTNITIGNGFSNDSNGWASGISEIVLVETIVAMLDRWR